MKLFLNFFLIVFPSLVFCQFTTNLFPGYEDFALDGGYPVGSVIIKKPNLSLVTGKLDDFICDKSILKYSEPKELSDIHLDRKKSFQSDLEANANYQKLSAEVKASLEKSKSVTLDIKKGYQYYIEGGKTVNEDLINVLPIYDLRKIQSQLKDGQDLYIISGVIEYEKAKLIIVLGKGKSANVKAELSNIAKAGLNFESLGEDTLIVNYSTKGRVLFTSNVITKQEKKLIAGRIKQVGSKPIELSVYKEDLRGTTLSKLNNERVIGLVPFKIDSIQYYLNNTVKGDNNLDSPFALGGVIHFHVVNDKLMATFFTRLEDYNSNIPTVKQSERTLELYSAPLNYRIRILDSDKRPLKDGTLDIQMSLWDGSDQHPKQEGLQINTTDIFSIPKLDGYGDFNFHYDGGSGKGYVKGHFKNNIESKLIFLEFLKCD